MKRDSIEPPRVPSPDSADGSIALRNWMTCMGLSSGARLVYALIYQFSEDGAGVYNGGLRYAALRCGMSERTARSAVRELMERGYIREVGNHVNGDRTSGRCLQALAAPADAAREAWRERFASVYAGLLKPELVWDESDLTPAKSATHAISSGVISATHAEIAGVDGALTPAESATPAISSAVNPATPAKTAGVKEGVQNDGFAGRQSNMTSDANRPLQKLQGSEEGIDNILLDNIYSYPIPSNPIPESTPQVEGRVEPWPGWLGMATLTASAVNRHRLDAVEDRYRALLGEGFGVDQIQAAWDVRQDDARATVSEARYMPNLADWLSNPGATGARAMMHAMRVAAERSARERAEGAVELIGLHVPGTGLCFGYKVDGCVRGPLVDAEGLIPVEGGDERAQAALGVTMGDAA